MASKFPQEVSAIRDLRMKYPKLPQKTLAKRIKAADFESDDDKVKARTGTNNGCRTLLSIYSVIRRYDAQAIKTTKTAA